MSKDSGFKWPKKKSSSPDPPSPFSTSATDNFFEGENQKITAQREAVTDPITATLLPSLEHGRQVLEGLQDSNFGSGLAREVSCTGFAVNLTVNKHQFHQWFDVNLKEYTVQGHPNVYLPDNGADSTELTLAEALELVPLTRGVIEFLSAGLQYASVNMDIDFETEYTITIKKGPNRNTEAKEISQDKLEEFYDNPNPGHMFIVDSNFNPTAVVNAFGGTHKWFIDGRYQLYTFDGGSQFTRVPTERYDTEFTTSGHATEVFVALLAGISNFRSSDEDAPGITVIVPNPTARPRITKRATLHATIAFLESGGAVSYSAGIENVESSWQKDAVLLEISNTLTRRSKDLVLVAAAGNKNFSPMVHQPSPFPAFLPEVLAVGSACIIPDGTRPATQWGWTASDLSLDVTSPRAFPDVRGVGGHQDYMYCLKLPLFSTQHARKTQERYNGVTGNETIIYGGSSCATPCVAAYVTSLGRFRKQVGPSFSFADVVDFMRTMHSGRPEKGLIPWTQLSVAFAKSLNSSKNSLRGLLPHHDTKLVSIEVQDGSVTKFACRPENEKLLMRQRVQALYAEFPHVRPHVQSCISTLEENMILSEADFKLLTIEQWEQLGIPIGMRNRLM